MKTQREIRERLGILEKGFNDGFMGVDGHLVGEIRSLNWVLESAPVKRDFPFIPKECFECSIYRKR